MYLYKCCNTCFPFFSIFFQCVPIMGLGFRRGSYRCVCKDGFYFPNVTSPHKYYNGTVLEEEYEKKFDSVSLSFHIPFSLFYCFFPMLILLKKQMYKPTKEEEQLNHTDQTDVHHQIILLSFLKYSS